MPGVDGGSDASHPRLEAPHAPISPYQVWRQSSIWRQVGLKDACLLVPPLRHLQNELKVHERLLASHTLHT